MRLGGVTSKTIDCTIVAATNKDLEAEVKRCKFRQDLFYRLNAFTLVIPPLRSRPEDIFELVAHYLKKYNRTYRLKKRILPEGLAMLQGFHFPGNVRELKNLVKKAVVMSEKRDLDEFIERSLRAGDSVKPFSDGPTRLDQGLTKELERLERSILEKTMKRFRTTRDMAVALAVSQATVVRKLKKYGLGRRV
jgi:TyrR family helix-turn-helix protein